MTTAHAHWTYRCNDYKSFLNFRTRADCLRHAFDAALKPRLRRIILIHPNGEEEVVTRDDYDRAH